jgi:hypothetical protein
MASVRSAFTAYMLTYTTRVRSSIAYLCRWSSTKASSKYD